MSKFHLDGSEVSWLVYADWLEDQDKDGQLVRDMINWEYLHPDCMLDGSPIFGQLVGEKISTLEYPYCHAGSYYGHVVGMSLYMQIGVGGAMPFGSDEVGSSFKTGSLVGNQYPYD